VHAAARARKPPLALAERGAYAASVIPASTRIAIAGATPSSRGPQALRPEQLRATFGGGLLPPEARVAHLATCLAQARARVDALLDEEDDLPPGSNGPAGLRSMDLAAVLEKLR